MAETAVVVVAAAGLALTDQRPSALARAVRAATEV
jgi:hypothetical protein